MLTVTEVVELRKAMDSLVISEVDYSQNGYLPLETSDKLSQDLVNSRSALNRLVGVYKSQDRRG